ncbi:MAG: D-inositol-3-phosphate glycosyltransferase [Saprospiraceae bacterium]
MKKIVLLTPAHPLRGGIASSSERLAQELQTAGHEVILYSFSLQYPSLFFPGKTQYSDDPAPTDLTILSKVNSINPFNWLKVGRELRKMRPDLIITRYWLPFMSPSLSNIIRIAKKNGHTKAIAIADNIIPHEKRPFDTSLTRLFIKHIDAFVVMSRSVSDDIRQFTKTKRTEYIAHPIYDNYGIQIEKTEAKLKLGLDLDTDYILFFGFIRDYKGLDLLLKAVADKRLRNRKMKLLVAGEYYSNEAYYQQIIKQLRLQDNVVLHTDFIPHEKVKYYFGAADLVAQPYKTATQSGISQLAYHFEKPMLVTNVGGLPEIVEHGKVGYVTEVNVVAISDAIVDFYDNNREAEMTEGVRENKQNFSWAKMVEGIEELEEFVRI